MIDETTVCALEIFAKRKSENEDKNKKHENLFMFLVYNIFPIL
jgi:nitrate reductase NapE component